MAKSYPPRPVQDFRITSFAWQLANEANHSNAGFPPISREVLTRRFWQYAHFIQEHGFTTRTIVSKAEDVVPETELRNSDLTPEGYRFTQRYGDRWVARMHKDTGEAAEERYLIKWLKELRAASAGT